MERAAAIMLRVGEWYVNPASGQISRNGETIRVEARTMGVLLCLAQHRGEVVSIDDLLDHAWSGVNVGPDSVYQAVASLRRLLGDDAKQPTYVETVPRLGYRMVAKVDPWAEQIAELGASQTSKSDDRIAQPASRRHAARSRWRWAAIGTAVCVALALGFLFSTKIAEKNASMAGITAPQAQNSIAVLPFLDLTERMTEEPFADGMTEELIDKLAKMHDLRVPSPTSSFYFRGKNIPIADIAKTLGVAYILDGSVRKSGGRLRVDARLFRADNGYVVWSEIYDRPFHDILTVQDDIAGEVAKALKASIEPGPDRSASQ